MQRIKSRMAMRQRAKWQPAHPRADVEQAAEAFHGFAGERPRTPLRNTACRCAAITEHAVAAQIKTALMIELWIYT